MCAMDVSLLHCEFNVAGYSLLMGFLWKGCFFGTSEWEKKGEA